MRRAILAAVLALTVTTWPSAAQESCRFVLGFATLRDLIGPQKVGNCLEDQQTNVENGNAEQRTNGGLMVWRKADNFTAFTDGGRTWINGPNGLQSRPNGDRFAWEKDPPSTAVSQPRPAAAAVPATSVDPPQPSSSALPDPTALFPSASEMPTGYKLTETQWKDDDPLSRSQQRFYDETRQPASMVVTIRVARSNELLSALFAREQGSLTELGYEWSRCNDCTMADETFVGVKLRDPIVGTALVARVQSVV